MSTVILAEKPDQARSYMKALGIPFTGKQHMGTGSTFLDSNTTVVSAAGHIFQLAEPEAYGDQYKDRDNIEDLPIIPEHFKQLLSKDKIKLFSEIKKALSNADTIIVGTDKDNEGAAIAFNCIAMSGALKKKILRAYPSALNKQAVIRQFKNLEGIRPTWLAANAALARSSSDWLIGMNLSRLYTHKLKLLNIYNNFGVGRAISTTLNLICQWYEEIENFKEYDIYELQGKIALSDYKDGYLNLKSNVRIEGSETTNALDEYKKVLIENNLKSSSVPGIVSLVESEIKESYPTELFTKGDLYKEMARVAGWSQKKSKDVMQRNYEQGYQTYPRTDSGKITQYMYNYLFNNFEKYLEVIGSNCTLEKSKMPEKQLRRYLTDEESAGAHLAIIPTEQIMDSSCDVDDDQRLMYEVVVRKALTVVTAPYKYVNNQLQIDVSHISFKASNTVMLNQGWKQLIPASKKKKKTEKKVSEIEQGFDFKQKFTKGDKVVVSLKTVKDKTKPLKPLKSIQIYDKGGLMERAYKYIDDEKYSKILKKAKGIGTSATRDQAMQSLQDKNYVIVDSKDVITVTPYGWLINYILRDTVISNPVLTAEWEEEYKKIENGEKKRNDLINKTINQIQAIFDKTESNWNEDKIKQYYVEKTRVINQEKAVGDCPDCGSPVLLKKEKWKKKDGTGTNIVNIYRCTNENCKFFFFRDFFGKSITKAMAEKLLQGEKTRTIKGFVSYKTGNNFSAALQLKRDSETGLYKLKFVMSKDYTARNTY